MRQDERKNILVDLIKWSSVFEAALPDFIDDLAGSLLVGTVGILGDRHYGATADALLVLCCEADDAAIELAKEATVAAEIVGAYL